MDRAGQEDPLTSRQMGDSRRGPKVRGGVGRAEVVTPADWLQRCSGAPDGCFCGWRMELGLGGWAPRVF